MAEPAQSVPVTACVVLRRTVVLRGPDVPGGWSGLRDWPDVPQRRPPYDRRMTTPTAPEVLLDLSSAHVPARALQIVAELGIADHLGDEPRTADEVALTVNADPDAVARLLRLLESRGIFRRCGDGRWGHTDISRWLRSDHPMSVRAFARMSYSPFSWGSVTNLDHAVRTGEAGICRLDPNGWSSYLDAHPRDREIFQQAMTAKAHDDIAGILDAYDFSRHRRIADIGGGRGHLISAIVAAHPSVTGVLFELPEVASDVPPTDRLDVVAGDFFNDPLPQADAYLLMNLIHDWDDKYANAILSAVADAARSNAARVLLLEVVMPDTADPHWAKTLDVMMLAITGGRERTLVEYDTLIAGAGMELVGVTPTATPFSIIEATVR